MRPKERRNSGQSDLFRARSEIVDRLPAGETWPGDQLAVCGGSVRGSLHRCARSPAALPTRLMAGLAILKAMHNLSNEALCDHWIETPYLKLF